MSDYLAVAELAAYRAGELLQEHFNRKQSITYKGRINLLTKMDQASEELIFRLIRSFYPSHDFLCEEGNCRQGNSQYKWIVDPLDGTTNYAHHFPWYGVSIALQSGSDIIAGAVYHPSFKEMFTAVKGQGAYLNGKAIQVSKVRQLQRALLATGFSYDVWRNPGKTFSRLEALVTKAQALRRPGAASLDLCSLACGRFDGFWEQGLQPWDTAAGALIIAEAGGRLSDFAGKPFSIYHPEILASNGRLHEQMLAVLKT